MGFWPLLDFTFVGYAGTANEEAKAPLVGGQFFDIGGSGNFDLQKFTIPGSKEWDDGEWSCEYMNPALECLRVLNTSSLADTDRYTYITAEFIIDNVGDLCETPEDELEAALAPYKWAIGWWKYPLTGRAPDYAGLIEDGETESEWFLKGAPISFPNGTSFVANFAPGNARRLISNGEVAVKPFAYSNAGAKAPVFGSQLPVDIDLSDLAIPGSKEWDDGEWSCEYLNPALECIRALNTSSLADTARYTYITEEFIIDNIGDLCETPEAELPAAIAPYLWAVGWWKYPLTGRAPDYAGLIEDGETDSEWIVKEPVTIKAGRGFFGNFAPGQVRQINFPGALDVPSKK